jgi:hypothetical protein
MLLLLRLALLTLAALSCLPALAGEKKGKTDEIEPRNHTDYSAYTLEQNQWRLGPSYLDYGLLDNFQVGTTPWLWALPVQNVHGKIRAIDVPRRRLAASVDSQVWVVPLTPLGIAGGQALVNQIGFTGSWRPLPSRKLGVHAGSSWWFAQADASKKPSSFFDPLRKYGIGLPKSMSNQLDQKIKVTAEMKADLVQIRTGLDYRFNQKHSLVIESNNFVSAGMIIGGDVQAQNVKGGGDLGIGIYANADLPLKNVPNATSIAWQGDWDRLSVRAGIPLQLKNPLSWAQPFQLYWTLGGPRNDDGNKSKKGKGKKK